MRAQKAYEPPTDVLETLKNIFKELGGLKNFKEQKFEILTRCGAAFSNHYVPNSQLFEIKCVGEWLVYNFLSDAYEKFVLDDVIQFYATPVCTKTPYETLDNTVPNLHIIPEYKRYNPEEDGISAFPRSSTLVTGLKYRKKYKGHIAKTSWP